MKKLIEELEKFHNNASETHSSDYRHGIWSALQIVRAHNPWHEVGDLPPAYEQEPSRSIEILILTADGNIYTGVYVYEEKLFIILNRRSVAKEIGWTYLPEVKP